MSSNITEVIFMPKVGQISPYIITLLQYVCDGKDGTILFEGEYSVRNADLPQTLTMRVRRSELVVLPSSYFASIHQTYKIVEEQIYTIRIHTCTTHTRLKYINKYTLHFHVES